MKKKRIRKRLIIIGSLITTVVTALIIFCAITGFNIKTFIFGTKATGNSVVTETDLVTTTAVPPTDGSTPSDYDAITNFSYFAYKLEHSNYEATTNGAATAKYNGMNVDQKVYDYRLIYGDYAVTDTRSTSTFVKIYHEQFYEGSKVLYRMGSKNNYDAMSIQARSNKQEFLLYGYGPDHIIGYIVCQETLIGTPEVIKNDDGTYTSTYNLLPTVAPFYYQRKVKTNAGIGDYPKFVSVDLTYTYDNNWNIISATYNEVYSIYKMKSWIETSNSITEKFTYLSDAEGKAKMDVYYNIYKDSFGLEVPADDDVPEEVETEMSALDYLGTMASLINDEYIRANVDININNTVYNVDIMINMLTYEIQIKYNDIYIIYKNNKIYFKTDHNSYYDINELMEVFSPLVNSSNSINLDNAKSTDKFDYQAIIDGIMADISQGVVEHEDSKTNVNITFNFGEYKIPTTFVFNTPNKDTVQFEELKASYNLKGNDLALSFKLIDEFDHQKIDDSYQELDFAYDINLNADIIIDGSTYNATANIYANIIDETATFNIELSNNNMIINLTGYYKDNYIYILFEDKLYLKADIKDILGLVELPETNTFITYKNINYNDYMPYLKNIVVSILDNGIKATYNDKIIVDNIEIFNISVELLQSEYKDLNIPSVEYINIYDLNDIVDYVKKLSSDIIDDQGFTFDINASYEEYNVDINALFNIDSMSLMAYANVVNDNLDINENITLYYIENILYVDYANIKISIPLSKIKLPSNETISVDTTNILDMLLDISFNEGLNVSLDITEYISQITSLLIKITTNNEIEIDSNLFNAKISNIKADATAINKPNDFYDVSNLIDMGLDLYDIYNNQGLSIELADYLVEYSGINILVNGNIDIVNINNIEADLSLSIKNKNIDINIIVVNNYVYITLSNQTLVISINDIKSYLENIITKVNEILEEDIILDFNNSIEISKILNVLKTINVSNETTISLDSLINDSLLIALIYENIAGTWNFDVSTSGILTSSGKVIIKATEKDSVAAPSDNLLYEEDVLEILDYAVALYNLKDQKLYSLNIDTTINNSNGNYFHIYGDINANLINGIKEFDAEAKLKVVEYRNNQQYGWHQINITVIGAGTSSGMVYATYGNNENNQNNLVKVYLSYTGVKNLFNSIMNLMKIDTFNNLMTTDSNMLNLNTIINSIDLSSSLNLILDQQAINKNMHNSHLINISLTKSNKRISLIELDNFYITYNNDRDYMKLSNTSISINDISSLELNAPDTSDYYDLDNISYLFEDLYNDAQIKDFEITGSVNMNALGLKNVNVPLTIKVHVCEDGSPEIFISLDVPKVSVLITLLEKKTLNIYYKDGFIYQNRIDNDGDNYLLKMSMESYMGSILPLLMGEYGLGMPDFIMDLITDSDSEGDGSVDASKCVKAVDIGTNEFSFTLNLAEIADNNSLGDLTVSLGTTAILWTNEDGSSEIRTILSKIDNLTLALVNNMIQLSASGLNISNISIDSNGYNVINSVDMTFFYDFINNYNANYQNDSKYSGSNGKYVFVDKISHIANFDFMDKIDDVSYSYYEGSNIIFPYEVGDVLFDGERYYQIEGWYSDSSYRNRINDIKSLIMPSKKKTFYANLVDITDTLNNSTIVARYNGESITLDKDSMDQIIENDICIYDGDNYLLIDASKVSGNLLINKYISKFIYDNETDELYIDLIDPSTLSNYKLVTFDVDNRFNNKNYKGIYFEDYIDLASYIPNGEYEELGINYWVISINGNDVDVPSSMINYLNESASLRACYSTRIEFFNINGSEISNYLGANKTVITPKYVVVGDEIILIKSIAESAFEENTNIVNVVINDGIETIGANAFKNCNSLKIIYFADSVKVVATDAFYISNSSSFETNRDAAKQIRFYFTSNSIFTESSLQSWLACKWNTSSRYYEKKEGTNLGLIDSSADLRDAYQTYKTSLDEIILNII